MKLIVAVNKLGYIGKDGKLMWKCSEDMKHFKETTMGHTCIVGYKTWKYDLKEKGLVGRVTLVDYDNIGLGISGHTGNIFVIGGAKTYEKYLPYVDTIYLSVIEDYQVGDTKFEIPEWYKGEVITKYFKPDNYVEELDFGGIEPTD